MQVTSVPPTVITLGAASPTIVPSVATTLGMPVTVTSPVQEALATAVNTTALVQQELSVPETILPVTSANNESQLGGSYLHNHLNQAISSNNVSVCSSDSFAQENLKTLLNKRLNDKIYNTFKEEFSNTNLDSESKLLPKVCMYNEEIAKFVHEINIKLGVLLDYTALEISEVPHWAETFWVLAKIKVQWEA